MSDAGDMPDDDDGTSVHDIQVHSAQDVPSQSQDSIQNIWWHAFENPELKQMFSDPLMLQRIEEPQDRDQSDKRLQVKEEFYKPHIQRRLNLEAASGGCGPAGGEPLIHTIVKNAGHTKQSLAIALFLLRLVLEQDPNQIKSKANNTPLLHHAISIEVSSLDGQARGLTSAICKFGADPARRDAIAETNNKGENCIHLLVRYNIHNAQSIIALVDANWKNNPLKQGRKSDNEGDNGNTPLHDALHFCNVAVKTLPCKTKSEGSPQSKNVPLCAQCNNILTANKTEVPKFRDSYFPVVTALLEGSPEVLMQCNSMGQSPYSFHLTTRTKTIETRLAEIQGRSAPHIDKGATKGQSIHLDENIKAGNDARDQRNKDGLRGAEANSSIVRDGSVGSRIREGAERGRENPKDRGLLSHSKQPAPETTAKSHADLWEYEMTWTKWLMVHLEGKVYETTGNYQDVIRFFFGDAKRSGTRVKHPNERNPVFQLRQRVTDQTINIYNFLEFEPRLALVILSLRPDSSYEAALSERGAEVLAERDARNIIGIFRWLKETKKVSKILKLVVRDNPHRYCSEETVEQCLGYIDEIRFLDWDRPDMSVSVLEKARKVIELNLYSSGTNAVLHHWSDQNGLVRLPKLKRVYLKVKRGLDSERRTIDNINEFTSRLQRQRRNKETTEKVKRLIQKERVSEKPVARESVDLTWDSEEMHSWLHGDCESPDGRAGKRDRKEDVERPEVMAEILGTRDQSSTSSGRYVSQGGAFNPRKHPGFEIIKKFALELNNWMTSNRPKGSRSDKIRVALMDDGVNPEYMGIGPYLARSGFPQSSLDDLSDPFYASTREHGSKMAWVISTICPFVEIHVAKIDNHDDPNLPHSRFAFSVEQAAAAVEWALARDVDIISMSWIFRGTDKVADATTSLNKMLGDEGSKAIIYCAARDNRGNDPADVHYYPAECTRSRTIGAASVYCRAQDYVTVNDTNFVFPSENVLLDFNDADGGNSVATAVAAGVAALVLYCFREAKVPLERLKPRVTASELMDRLFKKLQDKDSPYVDLAKLFDFNGQEINPKNLVDDVLAIASLRITDGVSQDEFDVYPRRLARRETGSNRR